MSSSDQSSAPADPTTAAASTATESGSPIAGGEPPSRVEALQREVHALQQRLAEYESQRREHDEFISLIGHELRTPLTSIRGYAQLLLRQQPTMGDDPWNKSLRSGLQIVIDQSDRLSDLTNLLLDVARVRTGRLALRLSRIDLASLVLQAVTDTRQRPDFPPIDLQSPESGPVLDADSNRLKQTLTTLLRHAAERSPSGHTVTVRLTTVHIGNGENLAEISIGDEGSPLDQDEAARLFGHLVKARSAGSDDRVLGRPDMFVLAGIVRAHGGEVSVTSPATGSRNGACITVRLPLGS
jgi:signal transduction histidine kinase